MSDAPTNPIPAATLVVFRKGRAGPEPELLMVTRSAAMSFAGGAAVFPGGRVDPADRDLAGSFPDRDPDETAHRIAAIRETLEETGLAIGLRGDIDASLAWSARELALERQSLAPVLDRFALQLDLDALTPFARWLPLGLAHSRIFDTRFYLANVGTGAVEIAADETENTRLFWATAREALEMADRGEIDVIFPTRRNLERLALFATYDLARTHAESTPIVTITPEIDESGDVPLLRIPEGAGYPVTTEPIDRAKRLTA